jgi:hypothetical protein
MESSRFYDIDNNVTKQNKCRDLSVEANIIRAATAFIILSKVKTATERVAVFK